MLSPGAILENRYEIRKLLGQGGSSCVYLAYDRETCRNWAIKEIYRCRNNQTDIMVEQETALIQRLGYPYFPKLEEILEKEELYYIVMEYLEGETLGQILTRTGGQPWQQVVRWTKDMCLVLGYLHDCQPPVIYRDMKPENIMLQPGGNLRLIDFGTVWTAEGNNKKVRVSFGTKGYAAPEQLNGEPIDVRTDIYGLGATMYHLLTGKDPCQFPCGEYSIRYWNRRLPRKLDKIVQKCTHTYPINRYSSCEELREALERI